MVNGKDKGYRFEISVRDLLRDKTGLEWERTPGSGSLGAQHALKGDIYIVRARNNYTIEAKHFKESEINHLLLDGKSNKIVMDWFPQTVREADQNKNKPLLVFKWDRSKIYCVTYEKPPENVNHLYISRINAYLWFFDDLLNYGNIKWTD